jgi:hypothetical protein
MQRIINNPYRILGVLAGASNREITRQANNLKKYIAAGVELPVDFSFAKLDNFQRTVEDIDNAIEKNDTDSQKIENALFWFWKGNDITDEPAFDALKEGKIETALDIWEKLISETKEDGKCVWRKITEKNMSAFHNIFVAPYLTNREVNTHITIKAQIYFLESDYWQNFKEAVTDITFIFSKKELQLLFLNMLISEKAVEIGKLVKIIEKINFVAKADFLKNISKTFTEKITAQIDISEKKRKESKANAALTGENLYQQTQADLKQLKEIFGEQNLSYSNIADKVANEILQCSIDFFNDSQERNLENGYYDRTEKLAKIAQSIAIGSVAKEKISKNLGMLEEIKNQEIAQAIELFQSVKNAYETSVKEIDTLVGSKRISGVPINWYKVEELKRNSINWNKVDELLRDVLSDKNLEKIKSCTDASLKQKFIELAEWVKSHSSNKYVINTVLDKYYGRTTRTTKTKTTSSNTSSFFSVVDDWLSENYNCGCAISIIIGIIIVIIILITNN